MSDFRPGGVIIERVCEPEAPPDRRPMSQVVIENPILNSPFEEPRRHFKFTDEVVEQRRPSSYTRRGQDWHVPILTAPRIGSVCRRWPTNRQEDSPPSFPVRLSPPAR